MDLSFMQNDLVLAICRTLIHSLWQGLLLAIVIGVVMIATRKSNAKKRYDLLTMLFFLFAVVTVITFVRELNTVSVKTPGKLPYALMSGKQDAVSAVQISDTNNSLLEKTWLQRFKEYFDQHATLIVAIWFIIFIARFIRLTANLIYVQRLRNYKTFAVPELWEEKIRELIALLGIRKQIQVFESGIVKVPVVMGVLKPLILLPAGLLAHLPADEIEAILLHELAHIQRRDYFVNLLQNIAETIFFFNPAVMWLSAMIREERENCCDDIAIAVTNNRTQFINALISFQEYNLAGSAYGIAFPGGKNHLLNRVKRIISERNKTLNATEKSLLTFGMAVLIMFSFVAAKKAPENQLKVEIKKKSLPASVEPNKQELLTAYVSENKNSTAAEINTQRDIAEPVLQADISGQRFFDTIPSEPKMIERESAARSFQFSISDTSKYFSSFSTSINDDGHNRTMSFSATTTEGKRYRLKKINEVIAEFYINDELISESQYEAHRSELEKIESTYRYKQERAKERQALALVKRKEYADQQHAMQEMKMANQKLRLEAEQQQRTIENIKRETTRRISEGKGRALDPKERIEFDKKVTRFKAMADSLKTAVIADQQKKNLQIKQEMLSKMNELKAKMMSSDSLRKLDFAKQKIAIEKQWNLLKEQNVKLKQLPFETSMNLDLKKQMLELKRTSDSLQRESVLHLIQEQTADKQSRLRIRMGDEEIRIQESTAKIKNIISDLEKENIKIDPQKSWVALDNDQFIVDGKKMSQELFDTFKAKYLRPNGWGYYYGPVQVTGRGVFLDYKNLAK